MSLSVFSRDLFLKKTVIKVIESAPIMETNPETGEIVPVIYDEKPQYQQKTWVALMDLTNWYI